MKERSAAHAIPSSWDEDKAGSMSEEQRLLYRSNLLGSDHRITNYGGGNTSAKVRGKDPLTGEPVEVLWVKGSGGDLGSMALDGFATLYMDKLRALESLYRGARHEDELVGYYPHATFDLNPRAPSIDTPLHAFVPYAHVDHMHPDAVIAIACMADGQRITREVFGDRLGWIPWRRPGYELGRHIGELLGERPDLDGVVLQGHGLMTWGETSRGCYENTLAVINRAAAWLAERAGRATAFGGAAVEPLPGARRRIVAADLMPRIRARIGRDEPKIGHFDDQETVLEFVDSNELAELAALGTSCPDHFLRTKIRPLVINFDPDRDSVEAVESRLDGALEAYRADYRSYYERWAGPESPPMRDPNPVVYLIPRVGMVTFAKDKKTARVASEFYVNAINVMREANRVDRYVGLSEQEAFNIEYWELEEAKLRRLPAPKSLAGRIALVTGGAGGIGEAVAKRLLDEGACTVLTDLDGEGLARVRGTLATRYGADAVRVVAADVTDESAVDDMFRAAAVEYGGLDILVSNAGIASSASIENTSVELWDRNSSVLGRGYFLASRAAYRLMKGQGLGGAVVFIGSKNALVPSSGVSAYCAAKASELHLARCLALEGGQFGIRVNVVNPDAVLRGSKIWSGEWRRQRAEAYHIDESELERYYRDRSLLKREVLPADIAEAVYFLASPKSAKSTGNILNVDAGNAGAFTR